MGGGVCPQIIYPKLLTEKYASNNHKNAVIHVNFDLKEKNIEENMQSINSKCK